MNLRRKSGAAALLKAMDKRFGTGAVMTMDGSAVAALPVFSTGSVGLDEALGCGGLPLGRVVEIYGPESSGKTTLTLHAIAEVQAEGKRAAFIDAEHALDPTYASKLGVRMDELLVSQPDCGEQALEIAEALISSGEVSLVVVDSVAALTPRAEIEGAMGDAHMGLQARLMSQALRKLTSVAYRHQATIIFINQLRQKIGVVFGNPETTTGGNALKFYASVRLDVRRIGALKSSAGTNVGNRTRVKVAKNKMAPPFRQAEFDIRYGEGVCRVGEVLDRGLEAGVVQKSGSWLSLDGERLAQGRERARTRLKEEPALLERILARCRSGSLTGALTPANPQQQE
ncbi:MAG: recombinase RecA [Deltaproteobacteria bacterium]|nr:recombinase RecA [Deltaproteobacteria bacterium]